MRRKRHKKESGIFSKKNLVSLFIVVIMITSVAGFIFTQNNQHSTDFEYNEFVFERFQDVWRTEVNDHEVTFRFDPFVAEQIPLEKTILDSIKSTQMFYVTVPLTGEYVQDMALVQYDFGRLIPENTDIYVEPGMAEENEYGIKVVTCADATPAVPVLYFKYGNETKIYAEGNCLIAQARTQSDVYLLADRILYGLYGIIE